MSLSSIILSGTLKKNPEKRFTPTNIAVTNLLLEVCYIPRGMQQGPEIIQSQVVRVNAWRDLAEECEQKLKAGDKILVIGRVQVNSYTSNDGKKKREIEVDANSIKLINDLLTIQPPTKEEKESATKASFKKTSEELEQASTIEEIIHSSEEIPF